MRTGQQEELNECAERPRRCFRGRPDGTQFVVAQNARTCTFLPARAGHAADDRRAEFIRSAGMPIHDPANGRQRPVGHDWAVRIFDLVEQLNEVAAANVVYLLRAETGIDQPLEYDATLVDGTK